jgi:hypothetical protein
MQMLSISNLVIPPWLKYVAIAALVGTVWGHGYTKGIENVYTKVIKETVVVYKKQQKLVDKVVKNEVPKSKALKQQGEELKKEGQAYAIKFPDANCTYDDEFVRLFNNSLEGDVSALSGGAVYRPK